MYQRLASQLQKQLNSLVDQYDERLHIVPGYANLPESVRRDLERRVLQLVIECLKTNDDSQLIQYIRERAEQVLVHGFQPEWFQQAVIIPQKMLTPLTKTVEESNFIWSALGQAQATAWEIVARERRRLEQQAQESLARRNIQVQTSIEITQEIAAATDLDELFQRVVTLIKERFDYYHTQLFRLEPAQDAVMLITGYGDVGRKMLAAGHCLRLGQGIIGAAAATGHSVLVSDVTQSADWQPNPLLPDTQCELAVPIKLRDQVLGILDVQSDQVNALTEDDRLLLEGLCGPMASVMESTRLLERTETLYHLSSQLNAAQVYDDVLTALRQHTLLQECDLNISINLFDRPWVGADMPEWSIALARWSKLPMGAVSARYPLRAFSAAPTLLHPDEPTIISNVQNDPRLDAASRELYGKRFGAGSTIFLPLITAGKWIGYVNAIFSQPRTFDEEAVRMTTTAVEQASTVIESLYRLAELAHSEAQLLEALRVARLANWEYDVASDTFTFNDQFYALLRTTAEREGGYTMSSARYAQRFVHPEDAPLVGREVQLAIEATDPNFSRELDHRIIYADGQMGYFMVRFRIEKDAQGRTVRTRGANQDITERKQIERALIREQSLMRALMETVTDHIYFKDLQSRFLQTSQSQANAFGLSTSEEVKGKTDFDFFTEEHARPAFEDEQEIMRTGRSMTKEERETWPDRPDTWVLTTKFPLRDEVGNIIGTFGVSKDITERKQVEETLAAERNRLRTLIDSLPYYVYVKDRDSRFVINNAAHLRLLGAQSQEEVVGKRDADYFYSENSEQFYSDEQELMNIGQPLINQEQIVLEPLTGRKFWGLSTKVPLVDQDGEVTGFVGFTQDITERKQSEQRMEEALHEAERLYAAVSHEGWQAYRRTGSLEEGYLFDSTSIKSAEHVWEPEIAQALEQRALVTSQSEQRAVAVAPLSVRGEAIGALGVYDDPARPLSAEELDLIETVAEQVALALESARLFDQTQRDAEREHTINRVTSRIRNARSVDEVLSIAAQELRLATRASRSVVEILPVPDQPTSSGNGEGVKA